MMVKQRRIDEGPCNESAWSFFNKSQKLKAIQKKYEQAKAEFEDEMEQLFSHNGVKGCRLEIVRLMQMACNKY